MHDSIRAGDAFALRVERFVLFQGKRHPLTMGWSQVVMFLNHLAVADEVVAATRNQALDAPRFLIL